MLKGFYSFFPLSPFGISLLNSWENENKKLLQIDISTQAVPAMFSKESLISVNCDIGYPLVIANGLLIFKFDTKTLGS